MKKGKKVHGMPRQLEDEWRRYYNHSQNTNISAGSAQIRKEITSAHKDQWRGANHKRRKAG